MRILLGAARDCKAAHCVCAQASAHLEKPAQTSVLTQEPDGDIMHKIQSEQLGAALADNDAYSPCLPAVIIVAIGHLCCMLLCTSMLLTVMAAPAAWALSHL